MLDLFSSTQDTKLALNPPPPFPIIAPHHPYRYFAMRDVCAELNEIRGDIILPADKLNLVNLEKSSLTIIMSFFLSGDCTALPPAKSTNIRSSGLTAVMVINGLIDLRLPFDCEHPLHGARSFSTFTSICFAVLCSSAPCEW